MRSLLAEAEAFGHALRSRSVGFAETLHRVAWPKGQGQSYSLTQWLCEYQGFNSVVEFS
ncbi:MULTISPECIES: hypothetical protein [unclassified Moorena]|uniref:hypothetical protein n=1 Tax=unclassified Moorena TaxID=2683338 RepID=UPI0013BE4DE1|nr:MULTISPECIES: hypothetical protein [unclassified Moorena]NEQ16120.1 hypothetical protein [Moorena sp. SIO3E2]NEP33947.1 hypothetical protein [Moorena sp. SIO3B2]NEQ08729.1 hypothetical protein [Moorena sp. SIO4E2]NER86709.1 hypothetical protein [Moorena sp. SIO3A2]NES45888.1 hypothetical protein [Moorena sp. SIO2C4]